MESGVGEVGNCTENIFARSRRETTRERRHRVIPPGFSQDPGVLCKVVKANTKSLACITGFSLAFEPRALVVIVGGDGQRVGKCNESCSVVRVGSHGFLTGPTNLIFDHPIDCGAAFSFPLAPHRKYAAP